MTFNVHFDGSCQPNPGLMGVGVHCPETGFSLSEMIGYGTNNIAEWRAAELALVHANGILTFIPDSLVVIKGDSNLVIRGLSGEWGVKNEQLRPVFERCLLLMKQNFLRYKFVWVPREKNSVADSLSTGKA